MEVMPIAGKMQRTMTQREKIILGVTAAAIVAGALFLIVDWGPGTAPRAPRVDLKSLQEFASLTGEELKKADLTETQAYILERASAEWPSDPFLGRKLTAAKAESAKAAEIPAALAYTGFVIAGHARLAVINGMEYQVGEMVQGSELIVQAIDPQNVVVTQPGGRESFNIPFTGEVLR
jgi:hypothetical protein